ncbi:MAG: formylglycine-generating enzyme family protein [Fibromonadales bacterium]|nr:formylglycine-generating enzyme family protein [Fibromonadales bacterium]
MKTSEENSEDEEKKKGRKRFWALIAIILLLLILFSIFQCQIIERNKRLDGERAAYEMAMKQKALEQAIEQARRKADSVIRADSLRKADSIARLQQVETDNYPSLPAISQPKTDAKPKPKSDTTTIKKPDTIVNTPPTDTIPPQSSILPPPGRYYKPITLRIECAEPKCETEISVGDSVSAVKGKVENYNKTGKVYFRATDSAGNASPWETAAYDMASDNNCAENSFPVPVKGKIVCVDAYEFPNKPGEKPRNMVSHEAASRLCENAGKRLCSVEEWQAACKGNSNLRYPYGNAYNQRKCATDLRTAKEPNRSGFAEHCRSYWGMYDMSGNLWEWTSTPAQREGLFLVAGGAWNTQNASSCTETKFSFYPQNEYPFVGLRCCL